MIGRVFKLILVYSFKIAFYILALPFKRLITIASSIDEEDCMSIANQDLIEALDIQIAHLEKEKRYYQKQAEMCTKEEKRLKFEHKVTALNTQIMTLNKKVLKLREVK